MVTESSPSDLSPRAKRIKLKLQKRLLSMTLELDPGGQVSVEGDMTPGTPILDPLFSTNFGGLGLLCIEADFCDQGLIFQHFSRSTRSTFLRTGRNSKFCKKARMKFCRFFRKNQHFISNSSFFAQVLMKIYRNFNDFFEICEEFSKFH